MDMWGIRNWNKRITLKIHQIRQLAASTQQSFGGASESKRGMKYCIVELALGDLSTI
jgi:hypothetical protein